MTPREMEQRLLELQAIYRETRSPEVQAEYRELHARWLEAKAAA